MMRRDVLIAAPAAVFLPFAGSSASLPSLVAVRYAEWKKFHSYLNGPEMRTVSEEDYGAMIVQLTDLEDLIFKTSATCAEDVIMQVIARTSGGDGGLPDAVSARAFWATAEAFATGAE